jgi:hypothetical protein
MMATNKHSLDRVLADLGAEIRRQITGLEGIGQRARSLLQEGEDRREKIRERREEVLTDGRDDEGTPIQPDLEEAIDWLESEGIPDVEDYVEGICQTVDEGVARLREIQDGLLAVVATTPSGSFCRPDERRDTHTPPRRTRRR